VNGSLAINFKPIVFLVDDDTSILKTLSRAIEQYCFEVKPFGSAREFLDNFEGDTGHGNVSDSVRALRKGALDFLEKPFRIEALIESIEEAIKLDADNQARVNRENEIRQRIARLTERERNIFDLLIDAIETPSK